MVRCVFCEQLIPWQTAERLPLVKDKKGGIWAFWQCPDRTCLGNT